MLDCAQEVKDLDGGLARMQVPDELVDGQATDRFMREILNVFMYVLDDKEKRSRKENKGRERKGREKKKKEKKR